MIIPVQDHVQKHFESLLWPAARPDRWIESGRQPIPSFRRFLVYSEMSCYIFIDFLSNMYGDSRCILQRLSPFYAAFAFFHMTRKVLPKNNCKIRGMTITNQTIGSDTITPM